VTAVGQLVRRTAPGTAALVGLLSWIVLLHGWTAWEALQPRLLEGIRFGAGDKNDPLYELGTSTGFYALLLGWLNFLTATRWRRIEQLFGGLDRVYRVHGLLGRWAFVLLWLHLLLLSLQALPDSGLLATYLVPGLDLSYTLGVLSVAGFSGLIAVTLWVRLNYQRWLATHAWMGIPFMLAGAHAIVVQGDWYLWLITLSGAAAWAVTLRYRKLGPQRHGQVSTVVDAGGIVDVTVRLDQRHDYRAGQFVYFGITRSQAGLPAELHPFSLSAILDERTVRLSMRQLGDYTRQLPQLRAGDGIVLYGAYGAFGDAALQRSGPTVWLAGGIGITPFLALLRELARRGGPAGPTLLIWSVRSAQDARYLAEIERLAAQCTNLRVVLHDTAQDGLINAERVRALWGREWTAESAVLLCGPPVMMTALRRGLRAQGLTGGQIISEEFAMR
jgi:predicted ferric reductase